MNDAASCDIAIIGMAGRFPGAPTLDRFWANLAHGVESITRLTDEEMLAAGVPASYLGDERYVRAAPVLDDPAAFDAGFFGLSPREARAMDPQHRILLELAHEALENAGWDPARAGRTGIFAGSALNTYGIGDALRRRLAEEYIPTLIGNDKDFLATRIAYLLDLRGPAITVQSACSTSLVAVHLACRSLLGAETDMALAGAIAVRVPHRAGYFCDGGGIVSPDGRVRAFAADANGTVFGSGGAVVVLKRVADAVADGDTIRAVIKGSAVNNDGSARAGYTAPGVDGQADAVREALAVADVAADSIGFVEAHGSGTPVGDPIEVHALTRAFSPFALRSSPCALGSVKTNVGHLDAAAGMAGLLKAVLALEHRQIPPSLHFEKPNPEIDFAATPFRVNTTLQDWKAAGPRRAGVSATGMGGTNAHIVLEEAPPRAVLPETGRPQLLVLSARTEAALAESARQLAERLESGMPPRLEDVAHTLQVGRRVREHRRYVVARDRRAAVERLRTPPRGSAHTAGAVRRPVVLLLPGAGDHYAGMGRGLYESWPVFRETVDRCAAILEPHIGTDIRKVLYPDNGPGRQTPPTGGVNLRRMLGREDDAAGPATTLASATEAQPALFAVEYATARLWQSLGVRPDAIIGHSMGEYVAACLAGVWSLEDALRVLAVRAQLADELPRGEMLAVTLPEDEVRGLLEDDTSIALVNGPSLCVVAGLPEAVARLAKAVQRRGAIARPVRNSHAFHSPLLNPIIPALSAELGSVPLHAPRVPYISNVTGTWATDTEATDPAYWSLHATRTARFSDALAEMWRLDDPVLIEAGPGRTLGVLAMQHASRGRSVGAAVASISPAYEDADDTAFFLDAIGSAWTAGVDVDLTAVPRAESRRVALPTYPFERARHWTDPEPVAEVQPPTRERLTRNPDRAAWLYAPTWKRALPKRIGAGGRDEEGAWLVFAATAGPALALVNRLRDHGHRVIVARAGTRFERVDAQTFVLDPTVTRDYEAVLEAVGAARADLRIVHAWTAAPAARAAGHSTRFALEQARGFHSLVRLAQALSASRAGEDVRLFLVTAGVYDVTGTEPLSPERATLLGPAMVIGQEYPNVRASVIDLDESAMPGSASGVDAIVAELVDSGHDAVVALRNGRRWVPDHEAVGAPASVPGRTRFRSHGAYLITGGLGAIGSALAEYLARTHGARLVLTGRTAVPPREEWPEYRSARAPDDPMRQRIETLARIERLGGEVLYVRADASDAVGMGLALACARERFGTLHGVIHAAGIVGDHRELGAIDAASCDAHFRAKALGAVVLHQAIADAPPDFCLLMSSLSATLGGIGQAAYAASNHFLDAFTHATNRESAFPWLTVDWDVWRLQGEEAVEPGAGSTLDGLGMRPHEAMDMVETVLARADAGHLVVSTADLDARLDQWVRGARSLARHAAAPVGTVVEPEGVLSDTEQTVARAWRDALGLEAVGRDESFAALGGHSLLAVRIIAELRRAFHVDLPVRALFDAPTVAALARYIDDAITRDAHADAGAEQLVARE